jgi:hypothetical protein
MSMARRDHTLKQAAVEVIGGIIIGPTYGGLIGG